MKLLAFVLFLKLFYLSANAEVISLPENCFTKKISPCLVRVLKAESLYDKKNKIIYSLNDNTILKWNSQSAGDLQIQLIQGQVRISAISRDQVEFKMNEVLVKASQFFASIEEQRLKIFETNHFTMTEYVIKSKSEKEFEVVKSDFATKTEMVSFVSSFYQSKKDLLVFLRKIERPWKKELQFQTESQTKVLQRSIASIENAEKENLIKQQLEKDELKKVRELFFYRTFYR